MADRAPNRLEPSFYSRIPHLIDDSELSPYAVRLYLHYKRVTGDDRADRSRMFPCTESAATLAVKLHMSKMSVLAARKELLAADLVTTRRVAVTGGYGWEVVPTDIWDENVTHYRTRSRERATQRALEDEQRLVAGLAS
jgi:hypothetical protein